MNTEFYSYVLNVTKEVQKEFGITDKKIAFELALKIINAESLEILASEFSQNREGWMSIVLTDISNQLESIVKILASR